MGSRLTTLLLLITLLFGFTYVAKAEVQNVRVGGDIEVRGIWQKDLDLIDEEGTPKIAQFAYQIARIYVSADLTDNVNTYVRLLNKRWWGDYYGTDWYPIGNIYDADSNDVNIDLAYLTLAEMFGYPVSLTVGRQELKYGEGFLVGDGVNDIWINSTSKTAAYVYGARKAFDAIKLSSRYEDSTIDLITAKLSEGYGVGSDENLYGVNWNLATDIYGTWDFAVFFKEQNDSYKEGKDMTTAFSIRGEGDIPQVTVGKLHVKGEVVKEIGKVEGGEPDGDEADLDAWGGYVGVKYTFENPYEPYIGLAYTRMTGDKANTDKVEGFDPMYQDEKYGELADVLLFSGRATNAKIAQVSFGIKPVEKLAIDIDYYTFEADQAATSPYYIEKEADNRKLGNELDLAVTYDYTEDVQFGLTCAVFNPGKQIKDLNDYYDLDTAQAQAVIGSVKVTF